VDIIRLAKHGLTREVWALYVEERSQTVRVRIHRYERETRPTRRHRTWTTVARWVPPPPPEFKDRRVFGGAGLIEMLRDPPKLSDDEIRAELLGRFEITWGDR